MNLHEYQAKALLSEYKVAVPAGDMVRSPEAAGLAVEKLTGPRWIVKAQVHAGGRGKAGGIRVVASVAEARNAAAALLSQTLTTYQTGDQGLPVSAVLIEAATEIARELYLSMVIDRASNSLVLMASSEGGVEIEETAKLHPAKILRIAVDGTVGLLPFQAREVGFALNLTLGQISDLTSLLQSLARLFIEKDLSLIEINPLVITAAGKLVCLDAKISVDDNALFRQPALAGMRDISQENPKEMRARDYDLNYIALDGNIGCMVNGAGLAMATMDMIQLYGAMPANFLDVGGGTTPERVTEAFKLLVADEHVAAILVNIFGGIVRCDLIAEGIISAVRQVGVSVPVVVRLEGNSAELGLSLLKDSGLHITTAIDLADAAQKVVAAVKV